MINKVMIAAPWGNWLEMKGATSVLGTYTAEYRAGRWGRLWRILKTVRYYRGIGTWKNKLGLPNPGIECFADMVDRGKVSVKGKMISITGKSDREWKKCLAYIGRMVTEEKGKGLAGIELNLGCPNVTGEDTTDYMNMFISALSLGVGVEVVVKLPPIGWEEYFEIAVDSGIKCFHGCNTWPVIGKGGVVIGGLSGKALKPASIDCIRKMDRKLKERGVREKMVLIGGGGITEVEDVDDYRRVGADRWSLGTIFPPLLPPMFWPLKKVESIIEYCERRW